MPLLSDFEVYVGATARKDIQLTRDGAAYDLTRADTDGSWGSIPRLGARLDSDCHRR